MLERKQSREGAITQGNEGLRLFPASGSPFIACIFGPKIGNMAALSPASCVDPGERKYKGHKEKVLDCLVCFFFLSSLFLIWKTGFGESFT